MTVYASFQKMKILIFGFFRHYYVGGPAKVLVAGFLSFCFMSACAPRIAIREDYDFSSVKRVAVLDFVNYLEFENSGSAVADEFVRQLIIKGFDVIERNRLSDILREKQLAESNIVEPSRAKEIGKILGVDAIVTGTVTKYLPDHKDMVYFKDETGEEKWDIVLFDAEVSVSARMIDVDTGLIIWSGSYSYESFDIESATRYTVSRLLLPFYKRAKM